MARDPGTGSRNKKSAAQLARERAAAQAAARARAEAQERARKAQVAAQRAREEAARRAREQTEAAARRRADAARRQAQDRAASEARERAAAEARRRAEETARQRVRDKAASEAKRRADEAKRRAAEQARGRAAEAVRDRAQQTEAAQARERAAEVARQRAQSIKREQVAAATAQANERAKEAERLRQVKAREAAAAAARAQREGLKRAEAVAAQRKAQAQERAEELKIHAKAAAERAKDDAKRMAERRRKQAELTSALQEIDRKNETLRDRVLRGAPIAGHSARDQKLEQLERDRARRDQRAVAQRIELERENRARGAMRLGSLIGQQGAAKIGGRLSVENLTNLLFDPEVGNFDVKNGTHVKVVQGFLRQHGERVPLTGKYDEPTHNALLKKFAEARRREQNQQRWAIVSTVYQTGLLKAGSLAPDWLPTVNGRVPAPGELVKILQGGGFTAAIMWRAIAQKMADPDAQFLAYRKQQLDALSSKLTFPGTGFFPSDLAKRVTILAHPAMAAPQARAQIKALYASRTHEEFVKNLQRLERAEEQAYRERMQDRASADAPWWAKTLHRYDVIGDWFRAGALLLGSHDLGTQRRFGEALLGGPDEVVAEIAQVKAELGIAAEEKPWLNFVFEAGVDPANFIPFGFIAKSTARGGLFVVRGLGEGAETLGRVGIISGSSFDNALQVVGKGLQTAADEGLFIRQAVDEAVTSIATGRAGSVTAKTYWAAKKATGLKEVAVKGARQNVTLALRNGFKGAQHVAAKTKLIEKPKPVSGDATSLAPKVEIVPQTPDYVIRADTAKLMDETDVEVKDALLETYGGTLRAVYETGSSFYTSIDRSGIGTSSVGASLRARHAADARLIETHKLARESADDAGKKAMQEFEGVEVTDAGDLLLPEQGAVLADGTVVDDFYLARIRDAGLKAANDEYERVKAAVGVYRRGSGDPALRAELDRRVRIILDKFDGVILPALQDILEEWAEKGGRTLFDPDGIWSGTHDLVQATLRHTAEASFDPENLVVLENPLYGKPMSFLEAKGHIEDEIQRRHVRWTGWAQRERERGEEISEDWLEGVLQREADEVWDAWKQVTIDGKKLYVDTRPTIEESPLYAAHLEASLQVSYKDTVGGLDKWEARLQEIALLRGAGGDAVAREIGGMVWTLGHKGGANLFGDATARSGVGSFPMNEAARQTYAKVRLSVTKRQVVLAEAYKQAYPQALKGEGAYWQALAHAQSRPLKAIYYGLSGHLALWRFFTLPLNPAWRVRNVIDNTAKAFISGTRNPMAYFQGAAIPGKRIRSVFDHNINAMRAVIRVYDGKFGTDVLSKFDEAVETFWDHSSETLSQVFRLHGVEVPEHLLDQSRLTREFDGPDQLRILNADLKEIREAANALFPAKKVGTRTVDVFEEVDQQLASLAAQGNRIALDAEKRLRSALASDESIQGIAEEAAKKLGLKRRKIGVQEEDILDTSARDKFIAQAEKHRRLSLEEMEAAQTRWQRFRAFAWDIMGSRPEDRSRRIIYRDEYVRVRDRALRAGKDVVDAEREAFDAALAKVEKVLFDYSKISLAEDNLKIIFPFIQFWRKNSAFWIRTAVEQPWLPVAVARFEQARQQAHSEYPEWMRRYIQVKELSHVTSRVPGLEWLLKATGADQLMYDPLNFFSFAPMYRLFKSENGLLPEDGGGIPFLSQLIGAWDEIGLGMNPLFKKPLEQAGLINHAAWRTVFPQTAPLASAFRLLSDRLANGLIDLDAMFADPILSVIQRAFGDPTTASERVQQNFDQWVNIELANQIARGEKPNREAAVAKIQNYFLVQAVIGFTVGAWTRRMTTEDYYLSKLYDDVLNGDQEWADLTDQEKTLISVWRNRKMDRLQYEEYLDNLPLIQAYYQLPDWDARNDFLLEHPQLLPHVDPVWRGKPFSVKGVQTAALLADSESIFKMWDLADALDLDPEVTALANSALVTDELRAFWDLNNTPKERREKAIKAEFHRHMGQLNDGYHAIPEKDYDARSNYLAAHPELLRYWDSNNQDADDFKLIMQSALSDIRAVYFERADKGDWDGANALLREFPFLFDSFEGAKYVRDRVTGRPNAGGPKSQKARDYLAARAALDTYFGLPKSERYSWLHSGDPLAKQVLAYFAKYARPGGGGHGGGRPTTQHARDYLAAKSALDYYFSLPEKKRNEWLRGNSAKAKAVKNYFDRYASKKPTSQKAKDYLAAKHALDHYFSLPEAKRSDWLRGSSALAKKARAYFDKYADRAAQTPKAKAYLAVRHDLDFYFGLKDWEQEEFLASNSDRAKRVKAYFEKYGKDAPLSARAQAFLKAEDWLEVYFNLPESERAAWLTGNSLGASIVRDYFDRFVQQEADASPAKLADYERAKVAIDRYYEMSPAQRWQWIRGGSPEALAAKAFFDKYGGPSALPRSQHARDYSRAKSALSLYYAMPDDARDEWLQGTSREARLVRDYFDKYASKRGDGQGGMTEHARDYAANKQYLDAYFALPKEQRSAWIDSGTIAANAVKAYFQKYAKNHALERSVTRASQPRPERAPILQSENPELNTRLSFWTRYFQTPPSERPAFVAAQAEESGVFVYGALGDTERAQKEREWIRQGMVAGGLTDVTYRFLYVKPLLDFYFSLQNPQDRKLFLRANPELASYFAHSHTTATGDPDLDAALERYFHFPAGSPERSAMLVSNPEIQDYFDARATPEERAMRSLLEVYFQIGHPVARKDFLSQHPEIGEYFDRRRRERGAYSREAAAFDRADPRLRPFFDLSEGVRGRSNERQLHRLAYQGAAKYTLEQRKSRRPTKR